MVDVAVEGLQKAHTLLADAEAIRDVAVTDETIVNRLYYACFHATKAVLHTKGYDPNTYQGGLTVFGEEGVLPVTWPARTDDFCTICVIYAFKPIIATTRSRPTWTSCSSERSGSSQIWTI
jgi:hypothetical protein